MGQNSKILHFAFCILHSRYARGQALRLGSGQALLLTVIIVFVVLMFGAVGFGLLVTTRLRVAQQATTSERAFLVAEAGIEDAMYRIRNGLSTPSSYALAVGTDGSATVTVTSAGTTRTITSLGTIGTIQRRLQSTITQNIQPIAFTYGTQTGQGGLYMENNAEVRGSVYANGRVSGTATNAVITGDISVAELVVSPPAIDQSWEGFTSAYTFARSNPIIDAAQQFTPSQINLLDRVELYLQKVGSPADITLRIVTDNGGVPSSTSLQNVILPAASISTSLSWITVNLNQVLMLDAGTPYWMVLDASRSSSNYYRWGSDSSNAYAGGRGMYRQDWDSGSGWADAGRDFDFRVWLGGYQNEIDTVGVVGAVYAPNVDNSLITGNASVENLFRNTTITGDVFANTIQDCMISGNARYNTKIIPCVISGSETTPTTPPDAPDTIPMPVSDAQISYWKSEAETGGTIGTQAPGNGENLSLGPVKISGNLLINNNNTLTVNGTIWVTGNIDIDNGSEIVLGSGYGPLSGVVLADGWIHVSNNGTFAGSGTPGSYPMLLSTLGCTGSAGTGCTHHTSAIDLHNNAEGVIFYAVAGQIFLHQNVVANELVGYRVHLSQNAILNYDPGLANAQFSGGPTSGWNITGWQEIP